MSYATNDPIRLSRDVNVVAVPAGHTVSLPEGTEVVITQALGGSYTLMVPSYGGLFRLSSHDADAVGKERPVAGNTVSPGEQLSGEALESEVWQALKTCFDPEIPVNIVDLGLIYEMKIDPTPAGKNRIEIKMTLTAQGCGMGASIAGDAQSKLLNLPGVEEADVQIVWEPVWTPEKISPEGRVLLGIH